MNDQLFQLTLEQQFDFRRMSDAASEMTKEQLDDMLHQASLLLMRKTNIVKDMSEYIDNDDVYSFTANAFVLSLDQQLNIQQLKLSLPRMTQESVVANLLETMQQIMIRDNLIKDLIMRVNNEHP